MPETLAPPAPAAAPEAAPEAGVFVTPLNNAVIEKRWAPKAKPEAPAPPKETPPEKPAETKPDPEKTDDATKPAEGEPTKPAEGKTAKPTPWQLVHKYEAELKTLKAQNEELTKKTSVDPVEHPKFKELTTERDGLKERLAALETELKFASFEKSPEYKDQYEKPYVNAFNAGRNSMRELDVVDDQGNTRPGAPEDFDRLMAITDPRSQRAAAKALFGDDSAALAEFVTRRNAVASHAQAAQTAIDDFQKTAGDREKQQTEAQTGARKKITTEIEAHWQKHNGDWNTKYAQWSQPVKGDDAGNALLTAGYETAKKAFSNLNLFDPKLSSEQRVELIAGQAAIINKGAAFDRLAEQFKSRGTRIKELETQLKQYQDSEPTDGEGRRPKTEGPMTAEQSFMKRIKARAH